MALFSHWRRFPSARTPHDLAYRQRLSASLRRSRRSSTVFRPRLEALEDRRLMAADSCESPGVIIAPEEMASLVVTTSESQADTNSSGTEHRRHNSVDPEDVNNDGECAPVDAL